MAGKVFSDIYNECARDTGDVTPGHITYVKKKVNDALREICNLMDFSWLEGEAGVTWVASQQYLNMSDVVSDWDEDTPVEIYYRNSANQKTVLDVFDRNEWKKEEDLDEGDVYGCHLTKISGVWRILFTLVPDSNFVSSYSPGKMNYQKQPTELAENDDVPIIPTSFHQGLVYFTNKLICAEMDDDTSFAKWERLANQSLGLLKKRQVKRLGRPKRVYPRASITVRGRGHISKDYNL